MSFDLPNEYSYRVRTFHEQFNCLINNRPTLISDTQALERIRLIQEELGELIEAMSKHNLVEIADAIGDLLWVVFGAAVNYGLPITEIFKQIHESNMSKLGEDGEPIIDSGGKILKGPNYTPVNLSWIIEEG